MLQQRACSFEGSKCIFNIISTLKAGATVRVLQIRPSIGRNTGARSDYDYDSFE